MGTGKGEREREKCYGGVGVIHNYLSLIYLSITCQQVNLRIRSHCKWKVIWKPSEIIYENTVVQHNIFNLLAFDLHLTSQENLFYIQTCWQRFRLLGLEDTMDNHILIIFNVTGITTENFQYVLPTQCLTHKVCSMIEWLWAWALSQHAWLLF